MTRTRLGLAVWPAASTQPVAWDQSVHVAQIDTGGKWPRSSHPATGYPAQTPLVCSCTAFFCFFDVLLTKAAIHRCTVCNPTPLARESRYRPVPRGGHMSPCLLHTTKKHVEWGTFSLQNTADWECPACSRHHPHVLSGRGWVGVWTKNTLSGN